MTNVVKYIEDQGGMLSGDLAKYVAEVYKIKEPAARKRVERLITPIHKLTGLFSERQSFIYHASHYNSQLYFTKLEEAFEIAAKRCTAVISAINYHHGVILKTELANYSFSPISNIKGHLNYATLIDKLKLIDVLFEYDENYYCLNSFLEDKTINFRNYKGIEFSKDLVTNQFILWIKNTGLISFNSGQKNSLVGGFQFAITGPSYLHGLMQYKDNVPKPGFLVADILIGNNAGIKQIDFFTQKIAAIRGSNPGIRLFPVLIIDSVDTDAFNKLKKDGVMVATIKEIFGDEYNELLKNLINTITNAGAILKKDPENYIKLMDQLTKLVEGKTNNLRGDLFELAVGYYYGTSCRFLEVGKKIRPKNDPKERDIDVLAIYEKEVKAVECKGYNYPLDEVYVLKYLNEILPAQKKWLEVSYPNQTYIFEIWSTGGYTTKAAELLEKAKTNTRKYKIDYLNKEDIIMRAQSINSKKFIDIMKNYYLKEMV